MAKRRRETLKGYFKAGKRPTEQHYEDLIDSALNTLDDGFNGTLQGGCELSPLSDTGNVISVFKNPGDADSLWEIGLAKSGDFQFKNRKGDTSSPILTLKNQEEENKPFEAVVDGIICYTGRKGTYRMGSVPADGKWHDILGEEEYLQEGCMAFEVVAGCGERAQGRYALMVATAMHCFGNKPRIHKTRSHFGMFSNKLCLRWVKIKDKFACRLQIKTFMKYRGDAAIRYQIANLWDDPSMQRLG